MMRDFKYEQSKRYAGIESGTFRVLVATVDNNETINDLQEEGRSSWMAPDANRRVLSVTGIRIDQGILLTDIQIPQRVSGQVIMPQPGDIIQCKVNASGRASAISMEHVEYSEKDSAKIGNPVIPMWLSMPGDYGDLRSHKDHGMQFSQTPDKHEVTYIPKNKASFTTKWVRSVTGTRWRKTMYEDREVAANKFVNRGDNVFDIEPKNMSDLIVEEQGYTLMPVISQSKYPEPNNTPFKKENRVEFTYRYKIHRWLKQKIKFTPDEEGGSAPIEPEDYVDYTMQTKYQFSYEPILDKKYRVKTTNSRRPKGFERELAAVEEYQVGLKGNNKLLIQDVNGDGNQILVTLKTQYDEGITFIHDRERSQVRIRDHIGNSVLLEGDRDKPRIVLKTSEKQTIEMGAVKDVGQFLYLRNGGVHTKSSLEWGRKPQETKDSVVNQEFFMGDTDAILKHSEVVERVSSGLASMFSGPGIYHRTVDDSKKNYEKRYSSYESGGVLVEKSIQLWKSTNTYVVSQTKVDSGSHEWFIEGATKGKVFNLIKFDTDHMIINRPEDKTSIFMNKSTVDIDTKVNMNVRSEKTLTLQGNTVLIKGNTVDVSQGPSASVKIEKGGWKL